jgi:hypothetical protein
MIKHVASVRLTCRGHSHIEFRSQGFFLRIAREKELRHGYRAVKAQERAAAACSSWIEADDIEVFADCLRKHWAEAEHEVES